MRRLFCGAILLSLFLSSMAVADIGRHCRQCMVWPADATERLLMLCDRYEDCKKCAEENNPNLPEIAVNAEEREAVFLSELRDFIASTLAGKKNNQAFRKSKEIFRTGSPVRWDKNTVLYFASAFLATGEIDKAHALLFSASEILATNNAEILLKNAVLSAKNQKLTAIKSVDELNPDAYLLNYYAAKSASQNGNHKRAYDAAAELFKSLPAQCPGKIPVPEDDVLEFWLKISLQYPSAWPNFKKQSNFDKIPGASAKVRALAEKLDAENTTYDPFNIALFLIDILPDNDKSHVEVMKKMQTLPKESSIALCRYAAVNATKIVSKKLFEPCRKLFAEIAADNEIAELQCEFSGILLREKVRLDENEKFIEIACDYNNKNQHVASLAFERLSKENQKALSCIIAKHWHKNDTMFAVKNAKCIPSADKAQYKNTLKLATMAEQCANEAQQMSVYRQTIAANLLSCDSHAAVNAAVAYENATRKDFDDPEQVFFELASEFVESADFDAAAELLIAALPLQKKRPGLVLSSKKLLRFLASSSALLLRFDESHRVLAFCESLLRFDTDENDTFLFLAAKASENLSKISESSRYYAELLQKYPNSPYARESCMRAAAISKKSGEIVKICRALFPDWNAESPSSR